MSTLTGFASGRVRVLLPLVQLTLLVSCLLWLPVHAQVTQNPGPGPGPKASCPPPGIALITVTYLVKPSVTDNGAQCSDADPNAIGCNGYSFGGSVRRDAPNDPHVLMLASGSQSGNLLVFFPDFNHRPSDADDRCAGINCKFYETAVRQGYHVIALSYFNESTSKNSSNPDPIYNMDVKCKEDMSCYGKFMNEVLDGDPDCDASICGAKLKIANHTQDSIVGRLKAVLKYAHAQHPCDGWDRYIKDNGNLDYEKIALAGFRHGASYAAFIGLKHASSIRRVVLLAGPMDGHETTNGSELAAYIDDAGNNAHKFYGIVHVYSPEESYIVSAFNDLGMMPLDPFNDKFRYTPNRNRHFDYAPCQVLWPIDGTSTEDADFAILRDAYSDCMAPPGSEELCEIGYKDGWKYMLGTTGP